MTRTMNAIHATNEFHKTRSTARKASQKWFVRIVDGLLTWQERAHARRHLAEMPDRILRDIGVTREAATREANKPFWKA